MVFLLAILLIGILGAFSKIDDDSADYPPPSNYIIGGVILASIPLSFLPFFYFGIIALAFLAAGVIYANSYREQFLSKKDESEKKVLLAIKDLMHFKNMDEVLENTSIEWGDAIDIEKLKIEKVNVKVMASFQENAAINIVSKLNSLMPEFIWGYKTDMPNQTLILEPVPALPSVLLYPGSDRRAWNYIPLGMSPMGEICWNLSGGPSGGSTFVQEDGTTPETVKVASAPQAMCVGSTGGGKSVTIQDIIFHVLTHRNEINLIGVDKKQVEFKPHENKAGVVAMCYDEFSAVEVLRIAREVMYERNKRMANDKSGKTVKKFTEITCSQESGYCWISGRKFKNDQVLKVKINGEEKEMTAKEVVAYVSEPDKD